MFRHARLGATRTPRRSCLGATLWLPRQSYRTSYPGETGQRNILRAPGYVALDMGLSKVLTMPWSEKQQLALRWEVFNVTNSVRFYLASGTNSLNLSNGQFGRIVSDASTTGSASPTGSGGRIVQLALKYVF